MRHDLGARGGIRSAAASQPALRVPTGSHFRVTGAGAVGVEHGIVLSAPKAAQALLLLHVTDAEIDYFEVDASNFAAIMSKVDPSSSDCKVGDRRFDEFVMQGISIHHNHLHDVAGEGIYLGNSFYRGDSKNYCGKNANCDLAPCGGERQRRPRRRNRPSRRAPPPRPARRTTGSL